MNPKLILYALLISFALLFSACDEDPVPPQAETSETSIATAQTDPASYEYPETVIIREPTEDNPLQFDFDEALNNIYIGNKKVSFPETLADLGEGFSFAGKPLENKPSEGISSYVTVVDRLMYYDKRVGMVIVVDNEKNYGKNSKIIDLTFDIGFGDRELKDVYSTQGIYKFRIGQKLTKQDVKDYFGEPTSEGELGLKYSDDKHFIQFTFDDRESMSLEWITFGFE